jgi:long-chain acyl-CoA synthetase
MDETAPSIPRFFGNAVACRGDARALGFIRGGELHWRTWNQVRDDAEYLADTLRATGVQPGERVAQVSENRYEWVITDLACHLAGAVHVPMHVTLSGEQIAGQIADCGAKLVLVSNRSLVEKFEDRLPADAVVWVHDEQGDGKGRALLVQPAVASTLEPPDPNSNDLATILYTSGTTGRPRGVMLSQRNLATNAAAMSEALGAHAGNIRLCVLPLSHIFARTCDLYTWVYCGSQLVLAESRETLARDLRIVRPTVFNAVPYVYHKIAAAVKAADEQDEAAALHAFFGGRMERLCSGGAPLVLELETWYRERGLPILQGYGLTEASPVISASSPSAHLSGSVGPLLPGVEARLTADGELLVRGPNVMLGYWNDPSATNELIRDGWLCTGDLAEIDNDGFLFIRGRKKELIVLSTGKKVFPSRIESLLCASPLIEQAAVFGDSRPVLGALIVLTQVAAAATSNDIRVEIERCLSCASKEEQIRTFALLDRPFSIERGELTPKQSLCRPAIERNFAAELRSLW